MTIEPPTIESCPSCEYDLRGLSASHNCPECGFAYDESFRMWLGRKPGIFIHGPIAFFFIVLAFDQVIRGFGIGPPKSLLWQPWVHWLAATAIILSYFPVRFRAFGSRPCILINNNVLGYRWFSRKFKEYRWGEIWIPDPRIQSWVRRPELPNETSSPMKSLLHKMFQDRGRHNRGDTVYRLSSEILAYVFPLIALPLQHFPRHDRKQIMQAIYDHWLDRTKGNLTTELSKDGG